MTVLQLKDDTKLPLSGGTLTGKLNANGRLRVNTNGGSWISQATPSSNAIEINSSMVTDGSRFDGLIGGSIADGGHWSMGVLGSSATDQNVYIVKFKSGRTANGYDSGVILPIASGVINVGEAIKNISRSGTTFTATRANGTTFTFTQQDNNTTYNIYTKSSVGHLDWSTYSGYLIANSALAYWNGRYNSSSSNLQYCDRGRFGTIVTKGTGDYLPIGGGTLTGNLRVNAQNFCLPYARFYSTSGTANPLTIGKTTAQWEGSQYSSYIDFYASSMHSKYSFVIDSDRRVKNHVGYIDADDAAEFVKTLKPVVYTLKADVDETAHLGFYAQDVGDSDIWDTGIVEEYENKSADGPKKVFTLDYTQLHAPIVAALQSTLERLEQLEARVAELEAKGVAQREPS